MAAVARKSRQAETNRGNRTAPPAHPAEPLTLCWFPPTTIVVITFLPFLPVLQNGFVNWDDLANLVENLNYRGLGWCHLRWMFTTFHESLYRPFTWGGDYVLPKGH